MFKSSVFELAVLFFDHELRATCQILICNIFSSLYKKWKFENSNWNISKLYSAEIVSILLIQFLKKWVAFKVKK